MGSSKPLWPFRVPIYELSVVREATQLEMSGLLNEVAPAGITVLVRRLLRMMFGNPSYGSLRFTRPSFEKLVVRRSLPSVTTRFAVTARGLDPKIVGLRVAERRGSIV